jgi:acyl-CoA thioesterase I
LRRYVWLAAIVAACGGEKAPGTDSLPAQPNGAFAPIDSSRPARETAPAGAPIAPREARRTIVVAGTSLTAGLGLDPDSAYPQHLQRMIDSARLGYEVVNAGVSGETSSALLRRLDWLLREPFAVFIIETGANDGLRGIPVETMQANIGRIVDRVRAAQPGATVAILQMEAPPNMGADYTRRFRAAFTEVARTRNVPLLPFLLEGVAGNRELNQGDGIHPNFAGSRVVARNVWKGLRPLLR